MPLNILYTALQQTAQHCTTLQHTDDTMFGIPLVDIQIPENLQMLQILQIFQILQILTSRHATECTIHRTAPHCTPLQHTTPHSRDDVWDSAW